MPHRFTWPRGVGRLRMVSLSAALAVALPACENPDTFDPDGGATVPVEETAAGLAAVEPALASASFAGGIPIGMSAQPLTAFGPRYNGSKLTVAPAFVMNQLKVIKSRGGRVFIMMAGNHRYWVDADGHFSLAKWKARVDRFKRLNLDPYVKDGTIIGHFMIDEPNDPANWRGRPVPPAMLDEMAAYSKRLWPGMATIVRTEPGYFRSRPRYVDAAWAQYVTRKGSAGDYIRRNVADAERIGLGLVVGLNVLRGGKNGSRMSASQVKEWGSELLRSSYPCAFVSWQYNSAYLASGGMGDAMQALRRLAENRRSRSCRG